MNEDLTHKAMELVKYHTAILTAWDIIRLGEMINLRCGMDAVLIEELWSKTGLL